ncbi:3192_t:CDS:2, partial [Racocetra persica]
LSLAIREEKIPKTMREVAFILGLEFRNLTAVVHKIRTHVLPSVPSFIDVELLVINAINKLFENQNVKLPIYTDIRQLDHLKYDLSVLNAQYYDNYLDEETTNNSSDDFSVLIMKSYRKVFFSLCMELLKYSDNDNLVSGRQPSPIGAAIVLLAIEATEKPSFDEWKNNHRRASEIIGRIFQIDPKLTMNDRYREMVNLMHSKVNALPWSSLSQECKSRCYIFITDVIQFHKWILNCREKGRQNVRHSDQDANNELIEIETNKDLDYRDVVQELSKKNDEAGVTNSRDLEFYSDRETDESDFFLDDDELEDYVRDEDEIELAKESWELYHQEDSNGKEKQSKDAKSKLPTKRCRVLRERGISKKSKTTDVNNNRNTHLETALENKSVTPKRKYTKKADKIDAIQERVQIESSTSKIKLNFDPNQINMALFDHI